MKKIKLCFLALAITLAACVKQPVLTNVPAGVSPAAVTAWGTAVDNFHLIETARHAADGVLRPLVVNKTLPVSVLLTMEKIDGYALSALDVLDKSPDNFSQSIADQVTALASNILTELVNLNQPAVAAQVSTMKAGATKVRSLKGVQ